MMEHNVHYIFIRSIVKSAQEVNMAAEKTNPDKARELKDAGSFNRKYPQVLDELFHDDPFFDPQALPQVKYEMLRRVKKDHWPVTKAAATYGFSRFAYYDAQANFKARGLLGLLPRKKGPRRAHKLSDEILTFISDRLDQRHHGPDELGSLVRQHFAVDVHPRSIGRALARWKKKR